LKQRHTVHGISRAALWIFTFSLNLALSHFHEPTKYNCVYTGRDVVKSLTYLSLEAEYAEGGLDALRKRLRRRGGPGKSAQLGHVPPPPEEASEARHP
jgi:hypothetical protein